MPNFSSLAGLEVIVWGGWGGFQVTTMSNSNSSCFRVVLSRVELRWVLTIKMLMVLKANLSFSVYLFSLSKFTCFLNKLPLATSYS